MSGSILQTFRKNYDKLCQEYEQYKEFHDTIGEVIPNVLELLDSLFTEEHVKAAPNYQLLVEDYLNEIKSLLAPENYQQIKLETQMPDAYDAPSKRRAKVKCIKKMRPTVKKTPGAAGHTATDPTAPALVGAPAKCVAPVVIDPYSGPNKRRKAPAKMQRRAGGAYPSDQVKPDGGEASSLPIKINVALQQKQQDDTEIGRLKKALAAPAPAPAPQPKIPIPVAATRYRTPLQALQEKNAPPKSTSFTGPPERKKMPSQIHISLPGDDNTRAILMDDGRIIDARNGQERGQILPTGKIILDKKEFGAIAVVDRTETDKYSPVSGNFARCSAVKSRG